MKTVERVFLACVLAIAATVDAAWAAGDVHLTVDGQWTIDSEGMIAPAVSIGATVTIPSVVEMKDGEKKRTIDVKGIASDAFKSQAQLTKVAFAEGSKVATIGMSAFSWCSALKEIEFPTSLKSIDYEAFLRCEKLTKVVFPNGVEIIGDGAFSSCRALKEIVFSESLQSISRAAFFGCENLTEVALPDGVETIGDKAFMNTALEEISLPLKLRTLGTSAFKICKNLKSVSFPEGCLLEEFKSGIFDECPKLERVAIPSNLSKIDIGAFKGTSIKEFVVMNGNQKFYEESGVLFSKYDNVKALVCFPSGKDISEYAIPDGVTKIEDNAFFRCGSLTTITIPSSVSEIGNSAFVETSISKFVVKEGNQKFYEESGVLFSKQDDVKALVCFPSGKDISEYTIPDGVRKIEDNAFLRCGSLTIVIFPEGVTSIGYCAFRGCENLTTVRIHEGVTSIGSCAFSGCTNLTTLDIPVSVRTIDSHAFIGCSKLTKLYWLADVDKVKIYYDVFETVGNGCSEKPKLYVRKQQREKFSDLIWNRFKIVEAWIVTFKDEEGKVLWAQMVSADGGTIEEIQPLPIEKKGYTAKWYCNGEEYDFTKAVTNDVELTAKWVKASAGEEFSVSYSAPEHGELVVKRRETVVTSGETVAKGTELVITATPEAGYKLASLSVNGNPFTSGSTYTVFEAVNVTATFVEEKVSLKFKVDYNAPEHGQLVVKNGEVEVESGTEVDGSAMLTITATPEAGYKLASLTVNGNPFTSGTQHKLEGNVRIEAKFEKETISVKPVLPPSAVEVVHMRTLAFSPNPASICVAVNGLEGEDMVRVYNLTGAKVLESRISDGGNLDIRRLSAGVYVVRTERGVGRLVVSK